MKHALTIFLHFFFLNCIYPQNATRIVTTDIDNFWTAYDKIVTTGDKSEQLYHLNKLFIEKGTPGLQAMIKARRYTPEEYVDAINSKREYWASIRPNTLKAGEFAGEIESGVEKLRKIYPALKPADVYFTVGVFRSGGTTSGSSILIGSEIVFADEQIMDNLVFTNVHEYVHTQQKRNEIENLMGQSVMEGVAEFVTVKALDIPSFAPAINYGKNNESRVKNVFAAQMFNPYFNYWLYSDAKNEFNTRDLGYYVGYAIAEKYYEKAKDKKLAIKEMIELDYDNPAVVAKFVDKSGYFPKSIKTLAKDYEKNRPRVVSIDQFRNENRKVSPKTTRLTIGFSKEMNPNYRNFNFGSLGKENSIRIKNVLGFSADGKSFSVEIESLQPNRRYQLVIGGGFRDKAGVSLKPYLIDITTADQ
jgi:hypothetical protein